METTYSKEELRTLRGLPHLQRLIYAFALRPYVDYKTGIVGIKRGISYQSIAEELYIEPHVGMQHTGSPSKQKIRRALQGLIKAELISSIKHEKKLVFKCSLLTRDESAQNKAGTNTIPQAVPSNSQNVIYFSGNYAEQAKKVDTSESAQVGTPLNNNIYIFLLSAFEKFWDAYPVKRSREAAWDSFQKLSLDEALLQTLLTALEQQKQARIEAEKYKQWLPNWKNPANWLREKCWQDEIKIEKSQGKNYANKQSNFSKLSGSALLWESCRGAFDDEQDGTGF